MCGQRTRTGPGTGPGRPSVLFELKRNHRNLHTQEDRQKRESESERGWVSKRVSERESAFSRDPVPPPPYLFAFAFAQGPREFQVEDALTRTHRMINKFFSSIFYELFSLFFTTFNFFRCVFYSNFLCSFRVKFRLTMRRTDVGQGCVASSSSSPSSVWAWEHPRQLKAKVVLFRLDIWFAGASALPM